MTGRVGAGGLDFVTGPVAFAGREGELSRLLKALGGRARMVLVVGDAGVGKTRFTGEGMARAAAAGLVMVRGECLPLAGALPLLPVATALGELAGLEGGGLLAAALEAAPEYVQEEVGRLLPGLRPGSPAVPAGGGGWQRERLFSALAELLAAVAARSVAGAGLVIEDVHWADSATLDCLTFLGRAGRGDGVRVVVTCRGDEAPLGAQVAGWLAQARGSGRVEEIRLGPLSRAEAAEQIAALTGGPVAASVADALYGRAEGNPFFTEQLVAAALAGAPEGVLRVPVGLPARLAELLTARAGRCTGDSRVVLAALAVAGRPLAEDQASAVTGLDVQAVRRGLRELAAARLLADDTPGGAHRPRHALLAEAVAADLLPGEQAVLHERVARALEAAGGETLAAEAAGHWAAAGRTAEELTARVAAGEAAERVFAYAEAAAHWQRAMELSQALPGAVRPADLDLPRLHVRAIDALEMSGDGVRAGAVAEDAYRQFAGHPDPATAAVICHRAAHFRSIEALAAGLPLMKEALRLFGQAPPSADHAEAWLDYSTTFLFGEGRLQAALAAVDRAVEIAGAAGAAATISGCQVCLADHAFYRGQIEEGFAILHRGRVLAQDSRDGMTLLRLAANESNALVKLGRGGNAAEVALSGLQIARQSGLDACFVAHVLAGNAAEALLAGGRTAEAAALIDPLTTGLPDRDHWLVHECRAEIDLLRGDIADAARRLQQTRAFTRPAFHIEWAGGSALRAVELALWAGRPADALQEARRVLVLFEATDLTFLCGRLLTAGMRACADLAGQARARRDEHTAAAALAAADGLASWADQTGGAPFTDHRYVATIPADRASWDAERTRLAGASDPAAWGAAAKAWEGLGCPHPAGYARWRQAEAQLDARPASHRRHYAAVRRGCRPGPCAAAGADPRTRAAGPHLPSPAGGHRNPGAAGPTGALQAHPT